MDEKNLTIVPIEQLPETDLPKKKRKQSPQVNCLQQNVIELMNEFKLRDVDVVKATGISWSTWHGWVTAEVNCQLADNNLFQLWMYMNKYRPISLEYLLYGIGDDGSERNEDEAV